MKKGIMTLGLLVLAILAKAETGFLKTLPAEDFATAGLQKLTSEELVRLETFVQRYKAGEVAEVRQQAEARASASQQEAGKKIVAAETKAGGAEAKARKQPGWFTALITLNRASEKPEKEEPLESRLAGDFDGWNGRSVFNLENGTRWLQQNKTDTYIFSPVLHSPKVKIKPAAIRGFWLEIEGVNLQVRVIPLELHERE